MPLFARFSLLMLGLSLLAAPAAQAQVVSGVLTVTGAEMHWWAGVAREATARLYDVTDESVVLTKLGQSQRYDHGTITFKAKKGKLLELDKLHESIWATRLSGGTRSGLIKLEVTAVGQAAVKSNEVVFDVTGSEEHFLLGEDPEEKPAAGAKTAFQRTQDALASGQQVVSVTGRVEGWHGRWPEMLRKLPAKPRKILVSSFKTLEQK